ncbi:hypothetical protein NRS6206_01121 [Bacillus subtilis]|nr:SPBc2 prophage-derived UPF0715 membrane protein YopD [Bacillus subtilis]CAF1889454.1 hypothetical protein NRS6206_01121 [Bacillus subtilis]
MLPNRLLNSYVYTLIISSLSFGLIFGLYMFAYSGFMAIALVTIGIIGFLCFNHLLGICCPFASVA